MLKEYIILSIYKRSFKNNLSNYQSITLLNVVAKVVETALKDKIYSFIKTIVNLDKTNSDF